jgi:hypothetical protein
MMLRKLTILLLLLLLTGCLSTGAGTSLQGKVNYERLPAAGITVEAYRADAIHLATEPDFRSAVTSADGKFRVEVSPGSYYVFARGGGLFSYYGRNPVLVSEKGVDDISLGLVRVSADKVETDSDDMLVGRVTHAGVAQADAIVFVYTDLTTQLKGMGYMMAGPTDDQGRFELALPTGTYYLVARKRQANMTVGPLRAGDFIGYYPGNPLRVRDNQTEPVAIPMLVVPEKIEQMGRSLNGRTSISGVIRNAAGNPVIGARVILYDQPQMLNRPLFVSQPTGADGRYTLSLPEGGDYYLAARNTLGGAPGPGELYGTYDENPDHRLQLKTDDNLSGIDIRVEEMW